MNNYNKGVTHVDNLLSLTVNFYLVCLSSLNLIDIQTFAVCGKFIRFEHSYVDLCSYILAPVSPLSSRWSCILSMWVTD